MTAIVYSFATAEAAQIAKLAIIATEKEIRASEDFFIAHRIKRPLPLRQAPAHLREEEEAASLQAFARGTLTNVKRESQRRAETDAKTNNGIPGDSTRDRLRH
jgi:hypothetical protein